VFFALSVSIVSRRLKSVLFSLQSKVRRSGADFFAPDHLQAIHSDLIFRFENVEVVRSVRDSPERRSPQ
jgi:hypothetical protein